MPITHSHPAPAAAFLPALQKAVAQVLAERVPEQWPALASWVPTLFAALSAGHSCVLLSPAQRDGLLRAAPDMVGQAGDFAPFIVADDKLYLGRMWQIEQDIAAHLWRLSKAPLPAVDAPRARQYLHAWFDGIGAQMQQQAAALALLQPLMLINGGPGTGKTTTVAKVLALICQSAAMAGTLPRIALAAPTGKAAAHMSEALHHALAGFSTEAAVAAHLRSLQGQTVHRLLQLRPPLSRSAFGPEHTLPLDILVVDEASMLDLSLCRSLLAAVRTGTRLILLGDANQLPAVGAGDVLADLAQQTVLDGALARHLQALLPHSNWVVQDEPLPLAGHVATLTYSHRFAHEGGIGILAKAVLHGDTQAVAAAMAGHLPALGCQPRRTATLCAPLHACQAAYWQGVAQGDAASVFTALSTIMLLTVWRRDAEVFNQTYRQFLSRHGHAATQRWFAGLPVMVTQNDYSIGLFNGDVGVVLADAHGQLAACFPDVGQGVRRISLSRLPEHEDAFAITVHKSQGSEYDMVWLLAPENAPHPDDDATLFDRALLYTALTRARARFVFCGDDGALALAVQTRHQRLSGLRAALLKQASVAAG